MKAPTLRILTGCVLTALVSLSGCATQSSRDISQQIGQAQSEAKAASKSPDTRIVTAQDVPWLVGKQIVPPRLQPTVLQTPITLITQSAWSLDQVVDYIARQTGLNIEMDPAMKVSQQFTLNTSGKLSQLLDQVSSMSDGQVYWKVRADNSIFLFSRETRSFEIPALNWSRQGNNQISSSSSSSSSGGGTGGTSGAGGSASVSSNGTGSISVKSSFTTDVWKELKNTAQAIAGNDAQVAVDPTNNMLVVTGTPPEEARVSEWVHKLSQDLQKQVVVDLKVYSVQVKNETNMGFNPTVAFQNLGQRFGFNLVGAPIPNISGGQTPFSLGASVLTPSSGTSNVGFYGTSGIVQALATMGRTSLVVSQSVVTLNGQPAPIQSALQTNYLEQSSTTPSVTSGIAPTTTLTPGSITTGFTAMVVPKVINDKILLGLSMTMSDLLALDTITSNNSTIQTPKVSLSATEQSVALKPGQTLMLTGFSQQDGQINDSGVGNSSFKMLGGGKDSSRSNQMLVVLVTARLM